MSKKKLDLFNLFYSLGAVIILIGVIAKFLEWEYEDELLISGLCTEALVFILSSIQYKRVMAQYKWERVFPELVDNSEGHPGGIVHLQERIETFSADYLVKLENHINNLEEFQETFANTGAEFNASVQSAIDAISEMSQTFSSLSEKTTEATTAFKDMNSIGAKTSQLDKNLSQVNNVTVRNTDNLEILQGQINELSRSLDQFNRLSTGILNQFKNMSR
jgi:gliding motility-associated protein GldL